MTRTYQICTRCIMDTSDPEIQFDHNGVCNHCRRYDELVKSYVFTGEEGQKRLNAIVDKTKKEGKNNKYDCIIGLSGGADSTYVAYLAVRKLGLRPLAITLDNGYDSDISASNVRNIVTNLGLDPYTCVIDWQEMKDLQLAYFRAGVINIEAVTDHAIVAALYNTAAKHGVRHILSGWNIVTEGILPQSWGHRSDDLVNLRGIHRRYGQVELRSFPTLGFRKLMYYHLARRIQLHSILNYVPYVKTDAKNLIAHELGWQDYGTKHFESVFTRFYQAYILPTRFGIDKRRSHLSCLICSNQMTREDALREMQNDPYASADLKRDKEVVLTKLGLDEGEFHRLMALPIKSHLDYGSSVRWFRLAESIGANTRRLLGATRVDRHE